MASPLSPPPYKANLIDPRGSISVPWTQWIRELFVRVGETSGLAFEENITNSKVLIQAKTASVTPTAEYTVGAGKKAVIDKFTATNIDTVSRTITVNLVSSGQSPSVSNTIVQAYSINPGESVSLTILKDQVLQTGDMAYVSGSVASKIVIRMSGREVAA